MKMNATKIHSAAALSYPAMLIGLGEKPPAARVVSELQTASNGAMPTLMRSATWVAVSPT